VTLGARDEADAFDRAEVRNVLLVFSSPPRSAGCVVSSEQRGLWEMTPTTYGEEETEGAGGEKGGARMEGTNFLSYTSYPTPRREDGGVREVRRKEVRREGGATVRIWKALAPGARSMAMVERRRAARGPT
jgi:hypothetical protein